MKRLIILLIALIGISAVDAQHVGVQYKAKQAYGKLKGGDIIMVTKVTKRHIHIKCHGYKSKVKRKQFKKSFIHCITFEGTSTVRKNKHSRLYKYRKQRRKR